ncbi:Nuclear transport factor 2 (NTF2) family protein [Rhynchospora pubera]|uniref:Nuclear transport factor 2 (NTF2) family protein n=1 Tax=Rhynchospora pubera TaxID=906938 RepID=A0AAV8EVP2_9POAL|nr:Nuclear transport factor 2 (NTF2) family protein [Rhynchospora pubera]
MNSITFSSSLPNFTHKLGTNSRSPCTVSLRRNLVTPKSCQLSNSKLKMQPKYSKSLVVAALGETNNGSQQSDSMPPSPLLDLIQRFYGHLNCKDVRRLEKLLDPSCVIEDAAYLKPLHGKKLHNYFEKLTEAMGQHVFFAIDEICAGDESDIAVMWHLEWNGEVIPFTKGCSFYTCSKTNEMILIRKAHVFVEAPFKPGNFALETLKIVVALFDRFPKLTENFLRKPDAMVLFLVKLYKFLVEPLMLPVIMYYARVLTYGAKILTNVLTFLNNVLRLFF